MSKPDVKVDILTAVYGHPDLFKQCADTLLDPERDPGVSFHWWIIDDYGPQEPGLVAIYAKLRTDPRCTVIMSKKNRGFAGANNEAARYGKAPFILLLNSDTRTRHPNWLKMMVSEFTN